MSKLGIKSPLQGLGLRQLTVKTHVRGMPTRPPSSIPSGSNRAGASMSPLALGALTGEMPPAISNSPMHKTNNSPIAHLKCPSCGVPIPSAHGSEAHSCSY